MGALVVDPWIMCFKHGEDADEYVDRLLSLFDAALKPVFDVQITAAAAELLEADGAFPMSKALPQEFWPRREDVYRIVACIVDKVSKLEDQEIAETLSDSVSIEPALPEDTSEANSTYIGELLALLLVRAHYYGQTPTRMFTRIATRCDSLTAQAEVVAIKAGEGLVPPGAGQYSGCIPLVCRVADFYSSCVPVDVALAGYPQEAVALALWQSNPSGDTDPLAPVGWAMGPAFQQSLIDCGLDSNPGRMASMIRTAVSMIGGVGLRATHALRVGGGPNDKQRVRDRDKAKAWRADIDDELHLHYWTCGGFVELANVVFHNCFAIEEG